MSLRRRLIGLVGTLMLAVSPTAIVLAQDAQAPTAEAPAPGKPTVEDILKRHKQKQQATPDGTQGQDATPQKPRQGKQKPAAQDGAAGAPNADDGSNTGPAMKPRRQKPAPAAEAPAPEAPAAQEPAQPTVKPKAGGKGCAGGCCDGQEKPAVAPTSSGNIRTMMISSDDLRARVAARKS